MAHGKSSSNRRRDVRRAVPRPAPRWLDLFRRRDFGWAVLFVLLFTVVGSAIAVSSRSRSANYLGQVIDKPIVSRVQFEAIDTDTTERDREFARRNVPPVFTHNQDLYDTLRTQVLTLLNLPRDPYEAIPQDYRESLELSRAGYDRLAQYVNVDDRDGLTPENWQRRTESMLQRLYNHVILDPEQYEQVTSRLGRIHAFHPRPYEGEAPERLFPERVLIPANDENLIRKRLASDVTMEFQPELRDTVFAVIQKHLAPTYYRDDSLTEDRRRAAWDHTPIVKVTYRPDHILVPSGVTLSADDLQLLEAERRAFEAQLPPHRFWLSWAGAAGLMLLLAWGVWAYVYAYAPKVRRNPMRGFALTGVLLLCQGAAVLLVGGWPQVALGGVAFATLLGAVIFAIVYDQRFALMMGLIVTTLIVLSLRLPMSAAIVMMTGVAVAVALLREVRSRSTLVMAGMWAGLAMGLATAVGGLAERTFNLPSIWTLPLVNATISAQWGILGSDILYTVLAGFAVGLLVQGVLPSIEKLFHVTTAMTLRELNDASHPLLQRLAQEAAGTYQHSLRIADMTEAAAEAIGADGLLCRVGAMYHDVGKINKPSYFIENQGGGPNKHTKLSPAMSLLIIVGHVKDGVEMAREYNLPPGVRHFVESHHGTTLVEYFYHAAKKQKAEEDKPAPSEFEFRYPGPKPQTKEAAIMLLCDGIEAAARSMDEPTSVRLEQLVHGIASKRLMDGQFDECNLTLGELAKVEAAVTKTLCAVYHSRIKYPDGKKAETLKPAQATA
jgi:putative nucleotidyltransferase with HDIG domain